MNLFATNLAYKYVALTLMLIQTNLFCNKVGLPLDYPLVLSDICEGSNVGPSIPDNFTGSILTREYFFGFGRGHLANFVNRANSTKTDAEMKRRNAALSKLTSHINTNEAYQMATNWLTQLCVDVPTLEIKYRLNIIQWKYYPDDQPIGGLAATNRTAVMLPIYEVQWHGSLVRANRKRPDAPIVTMIISGATKQLLEYHLLDDSIMLNPAIHIKDAEKLRIIQDEDFQKFDERQRSNLVSRFTGPSSTHSFNSQMAPTSTSKTNGN